MADDRPVSPTLVQLLADDIRSAAAHEMLPPAALAEELVRRGWRPAGEQANDDLREKVARAIYDNRGKVWREQADAVLAVVDPDALRDEVERLRTVIGLAESGSQVLREQRDEMRARAIRSRSITRIWAAEEERDAAVREAAALRAGVEGMANVMAVRARGATADRADCWQAAESDLRTLLAEHPTPEVDRG